MKTIFRDLQYEHGDQEVLVDFGSGAGRSTFVACVVHPFKAAHGVELMPVLVKLAQDNRRWIRAKLACKDIRFVQSNAVDYMLPDDATVFFLFNPFKGDLLQKVLQNIQASIQALPRAVLIVYVNPTTDDLPCWMERIRVTSTYPFVCHVYRAEPACAGSALGFTPGRLRDPTYAFNKRGCRSCHHRSHAFAAAQGLGAINWGLGIGWMSANSSLGIATAAIWKIT